MKRPNQVKILQNSNLFMLFPTASKAVEPSKDDEMTSTISSIHERSTLVSYTKVSLAKDNHNSCAPLPFEEG